MNVAIVNCFDTYEHRVDLLFDFFSKRGDSVRVYTSDYQHIEKKYRNEKKENLIYVHALKYKKNFSFSRILSHYLLSKNIFERLRYQDVDLLWVLIPPNSFVKKAVKLKKESGKDIKVIFDCIDLWPETMPINRFKNIFPFSMWKKMRDNYIGCADEIVTECDLYAQKLDLPKEKIHTIYLARKIEDVKIEKKQLSDRVSLCYLGSINNIIDISVISNLIKQIRLEKKVDIHIIGDGENRDNLINSCKDAGANVIYHGKIYNQSDKKKIMDECHYGLNIMKDTVCVGLTMKSMDYFENGLPIINNIQGDTWDIIEKNNLGFNILDKIDSVAFDEYDSEMGIRVRKYCELNLSVDSFNSKLQRLLDIASIR